jgi:hypothetical protein
MAYGTETSSSKRSPDGIQVAGIFDLLKLAEKLGIDATDIASAARRGDPEAWYDNKAFVGPTGRVATEIPSGIDPRDLKTYQNLGDLVQNAPTLEDYMGGTDLGRALGADLSGYKVGVSPLHGGFEAGVTAPSYANLGGGERRLVQPGFMAFNPGAASDMPGLIEHEVTHIGQNALVTPGGTNVSDASLLVDYLDAVNRGQSPNMAKQFEAMVPMNQAGRRPYVKYLHSMGEAEARAAQLRAQNPSLQTAPPNIEQYKWNSTNTPLNSSLFYENYRADDELAKEWRKGLLSKGAMQ